MCDRFSTFQNIQTYSSEFIYHPRVRVADDIKTPKLTDIRMVDLGQEPDFGRCHWVFFRKEELKLEFSVWRYVIKCYRKSRSKRCVRWKGLPSGPSMVTSKYLRLSSCGKACIPGAGSATRRSVSCSSKSIMQAGKFPLSHPVDAREIDLDDSL